jgi:hypothetical protein
MGFFLWGMQKVCQGVVSLQERKIVGQCLIHGAGGPLWGMAVCYLGAVTLITL